jgi:hypothetical protein
VGTTLLFLLLLEVKPSLKKKTREELQEELRQQWCAKSVCLSRTRVTIFSLSCALSITHFELFVAVRYWAYHFMVFLGRKMVWNSSVKLTSRVLVTITRFLSLSAFITP